MTLVKAYLEVLDSKFNPLPGKGNRVDAHFNPQSLQVTYRAYGQDSSKQREKQAMKQGPQDQQTGSISEVSMDLLFDTTERGTDVRNITVNLAAMIRPDIKNQPAPGVPIVRFRWGTFIFVGKVLSLSETIDFFSEQGVPLRSTVKLSMSEIRRERSNPAVAGLSVNVGIGLSASASISASAEVGFSASASLSAGVDIGTTPLTLAQAGDSLQALAGRAGLDTSWKAIAAANNIDNPRLIPPGTPLNLNAGASAGASASFSAGS
jgi:nucleoid-associated protein YgaU